MTPSSVNDLAPHQPDGPTMKDVVDSLSTRLSTALREVLTAYAKRHRIAEDVALDAATRVSEREHKDLATVLADLATQLDVNDIVDDAWMAAATGRDVALVTADPLPSPFPAKNWKMADFFPPTRGARLARWEMLKAYANRHGLSEARALEAAMLVSRREGVDLLKVLTNVPETGRDTAPESTKSSTSTGPAAGARKAPPFAPLAQTDKTVPILPALNAGGEAAAPVDLAEQPFRREAGLPPLVIGHTTDTAESSATTPDTTSSSCSPLSGHDGTSTEPTSAGAWSPSPATEEERNDDVRKTVDAHCEEPRSRSALVDARVSIAGNDVPASSRPPNPDAPSSAISLPPTPTLPARPRVSISLKGLVAKPRLEQRVSLEADQAGVHVLGRNKWRGKGAAPLKSAPLK